MIMRDKKIFILGGARSGVAAALLAAKVGAIPFVSELKSEEENRDSIEVLKKNRIEYECGRNSLERIREFDLLVLSPGVHLKEDVIRGIEDSGVKVVSELEFASMFVDVPVIAITGTNGKSTTTALIGHILNRANMRAFVGGNIGNPLSYMPLSDIRYDFAVVEVSSFMLENIDSFRPSIVVFTNISPDHLDKYGSYDEYKEAKLRVFKNLDSNSRVILNRDCEELVAMTEGFVCTRMYFSKYRKGEAEIFAERREDGLEIVFSFDGKSGRMGYKNIYLVGEHNLENVLASALATLVAGVEPRCVEDGINSFEGLEHRIEFVREIRGVRFYNDSKATNVDSAVVALKSFDSNIIWIAGGRHKGTPYTVLADVVRGRVKRVIAIGEAAGLIENDLRGVVDVEVVGSDFEKAIMRAFSLAKSGDIVLLSPACSSYDMFTNYEERGKRFKEIVMRLE
jgi:UDP-N-acetylmuramoylalanine--D-glutamate ligase